MATRNCCLKSCTLDPLDINSTRVEVKTAIPSGGLLKYSDSLVVRWKRNGEATFHRACWETLLKASRSRKKPGRSKKRAANGEFSDSGLNVTDSEKVMIRQASKTVEMFDSLEDMRKQAERVANMLKNARNCVFFTGAGISTSAGLGDFRGKGGKWTEQDRNAVDMDSVFDQTWQDSTEDGPSQSKRTRSDKQYYHLSLKNSSSATAATASRSRNDERGDTSAGHEEKEDEDEEEEESIAYEHLRPTFTHEAIQKLIELEHVKYLISQNCDGLHLLSGVPASKISELHGNVFVEKCEKCGVRCERPFYVCDDIADIYLQEIADYGKSDVIFPKWMHKCEKCGLSHRTGRKCEAKGCNGHLIDTIINFRDNLEEDILDKAFDAADSCDLLMCLGTTLLVTPAAEVVDLIKEPRRIVICNRQATERDEESLKTDSDGNQLGARIYGDCDAFMKHLMQFMLGESEFQKFEASLSRKRDLYNEKRSSPT